MPARRQARTRESRHRSGGDEMGDQRREPGTQGDTIPELTVRQLIEDPLMAIDLRRVAGEAGLDRPLRHPRVQKNGLALAGHFHGVVPTRVQLLGETELSYLDSLSHEGRSVAARGYFSMGLSCVVITGAHEPPKALTSAAEATGTPLFTTTARSSRTINALHAVLDDRLAPIRACTASWSTCSAWASSSSARAASARASARWSS
jgi:HPr kinase/phosphorylase